MDRNTIIGLILIFILFYVWAQINAPSQEEIERQKRIQDSIERVQQESKQDQKTTSGDTVAAQENSRDTTSVDTAAISDQMNEQYGPFGRLMQGTERTFTLENDVFKISFTNQGGRITEVLLKDYKKVREDEQHQEIKTPLKLLADKKNSFEYHLPVNTGNAAKVSTGDWYFDVTQNERSISFKASIGPDQYFEQLYRIDQSNYHIDYEVKVKGLSSLLRPGTDHIELHWKNYLDKIEKNSEFEKYYSTVYYNPTDDDVNYCSCRSSDEIDLSKTPLKWVSHSNQFFNTSIIPQDNFSGGVVATEMLGEDAADLKLLTSTLKLPMDGTGDESYEMTMYSGPNDFDRLTAMGHDLSDIIPFGWSIFGTINRWVMRPIFNFLSSFIGSAGLVILALTFIVKLSLFPLTYRMLYSQAKMAVLKPEMNKVKEKYSDDQQKQQMETMKMYREFGVNPLGGCLPMILQMPIWFALYRFFPASIEFRQSGFLWASDLSSYDVIANLPFTIPFYGDHISLFTLLWAGTTVLYTHYNSQAMQMGGAASSNPAMKYMQYFMPLMFLFFFNSYAAGLTCYLLFSTMLNVVQTVVTKNYILDHDKIKNDLDEYKKKPKKKSKFQERLENAMKEQQKNS